MKNTEKTEKNKNLSAQKLKNIEKY